MTDLKPGEKVMKLPSHDPDDYRYNLEMDDWDDDVRKFFHSLVHIPSGVEFSVPFSPYRRMNRDDIARWVLLDGPDRKEFEAAMKEDIEDLVARGLSGNSPAFLVDEWFDVDTPSAPRHAVPLTVWETIVLCLCLGCLLVTAGVFLKILFGL